ncbi:MAG TPA: histidine kinase, partial [Actinotalea sp.]|nr:histidine kinase [Actinotalea sp.]
RLPVADLALGALLVVGAALAFAMRSGTDLGAPWVLPALIVLGGAGLAWSQLDSVQREPGARGRVPVSVLRLLGGTLLAALGVFLLVGRDVEVVALVQSALAAVAVLVGAALVLAP